MTEQVNPTLTNDWKKDRIASAHRGENPMVLTKMRSGFAVIGDTQFLPGYCLLLPFDKVDTLNDLNFKQRSEYLLDMSLIGDAIQAICNPKRINYSIYGNSDAFLHAHIFPRYEWEQEERRKMPIWQYPKEMWIDQQFQFDNKKHGEIKESIAQKIIELIQQAY
ncbi:HIT family protein [Bacillus thuringiensis]|uniref:HIT family protein n=1 Tax=Bacillus thuringiensis TaxID=1428 RepID=UPI00366CCBD2